MRLDQMHAPPAARHGPRRGSQSAPTISPLRFSISAWPMKQSFASLPRPLRYSRASGSVVEACVSFVRFCRGSPARRCAPVRAARRRAVLRPEALRAGPGLEQRAVHREVLARQQPLHLRQRPARRPGSVGGDLARQQPVAVLGERASHPRPDRPRRARRTSGTAGRTRSARPAAAPSGSSRTPAAAAPAAAAPAGSIPGPVGEYSASNSDDIATSAAFTMSRITRSGWSGANPLLQVHIAEQRTRPPILTPHRNPLGRRVRDTYGITAASRAQGRLSSAAG